LAAGRNKCAVAAGSSRVVLRLGPTRQSLRPERNRHKYAWQGSPLTQCLRLSEPECRSEVAGQQKDHLVAVLWRLNHCSDARLTLGCFDRWPNEPNTSATKKRPPTQAAFQVQKGRISPTPNGRVVRFRATAEVKPAFCGILAGCCAQST
jgi:hypothetical protein